MLTMKVKYLNDDMPKLQKIDKGDWIDVRASRVEVNGVYVPFEDVEIVTAFNEVGENLYQRETEIAKAVTYQAGDEVKVYLGFASELPEGFEAYTAPRGSTFKHYGLIQVNSVGVVDESYCGDNDEWFIPYFALKDGIIKQYDRVGQFRITEKMPTLNIIPVTALGNANRGGHGSTGTK